jgi:hypothetical protein
MDFCHVPIQTAWNRRLRLRFCWRWLVIPFLGACIWGWCDARQRGFPHPEDPLEHNTDFTVYTEAGAAFFDGRPPYEVTNPRGWTYLYPPLFAILVAPLHVLPMQDQVMVWFVISLFLCWGCVYESARTLAYLRAKDDYLSAHYTAWYPWLGIAAVLAAALPTLNCLQRGQVGILKLYLLALGLRLVISSTTRWMRLLGGIVLAMPIVLKVLPLLPVCFLIFVQFVAWAGTRRVRETHPERHPDGRRRGALVGEGSQPPHRVHACTHASSASSIDMRPRAAGSSLGLTSLGLALGLVLFFLIVPSTLIGWKANMRHLKTWSGFVLTKVDDGGEDPRSGNSRSMRNQSLGNAAYRLGNFLAYKFAGGTDDHMMDFFERPKEIFQRPQMVMDSPAAETTLLALRIAILAALGVVGIRLGLRGDALSITAGFGLACVAMLVVSPVSRVHYFMLYAPAILYLPLWLDREGRPRAARILAVVPIVLINLHYVLFAYAGRVGLLGLGTAAWLIVAFALVARAKRPVWTLAAHASSPARLHLVNKAA